MTDLSKLSDEELLRLYNQPQQSQQSAPDLSAMSDADLLALYQQTADQPQGRTDQGFGGRFLKGIQDPIDAGAQMLVHALPQGAVDWVNEKTKALNEAPVIGPAMKALGMVPASAQEVDQGIAKGEAQYQADRKASGSDGVDWARMGGNAVGTLPLAALIPETATLGGAAAVGAGSGGVFGALRPATEPTESFWADKAKEAGIGAVAGGVVGPAVHAISRIVQPQVSKGVEYLMERGITPTPGQILGGAAARMEEKATSLPLVGDLIKNSQSRALDQFNRAAYNEALAPIGEKYAGQIGREGIAAVEDTLSGAYQKLLPKLSFQADDQFAADIGNLQSMAASLPPEQASRFESILRDKVFSRISRTGHMDGQTLKGLESELTNLVKGYKSDPSFDNRQLGDAVGEVLASVRTTLQRSNPDHAEQLAAVNKGWANYDRLRRAGSALGAQEGVFTPAQLLNAVKAADKSVGKGRFAKGEALMQDFAETGKSVLGSKYPDSGTAGRVGLGYLLGGMMQGGMPNPALLAGGLLAAPYTGLGQKVMAGLLTQRPDFAAPLAAGIRKASPAIQAGLLSALPHP